MYIRIASSAWLPKFAFVAWILSVAGAANCAEPGTVFNLRKIIEGEAGLPADMPPGNYAFGGAVASIGDLDGDGNPDLAAGNYGFGLRRTGAVHIFFLNADGSIRSSSTIADGIGGLPTGTLDYSYFGQSVGDIGDIDGDGVTDLGVGYSFSLRGTPYLMIVFLKRDGTAKGFYKEGTGFGAQVAGIGDLDGDGVPEIAVANLSDNDSGEKRGAVTILFLNSDGSVKSSVRIADGAGGLPADTLADEDFFGRALTRIGDFDGDCVPDLAVTATGDDTGGFNRGALYILFLKTDGSVKDRVKITHGVDGIPVDPRAVSSELGTSIACLGDLDHDGIPEIAFGDRRNDTGGRDRGIVYILFLRSDGTLRRYIQIADGMGGLPVDAFADNDGFGNSLANLGDVVPKIVVGTTGNGGALQILTLDEPALTVTTTNDEFNTPSGSGGSTGLSLREAIRDAMGLPGFNRILFDPSLDGQTLNIAGSALYVGDQDLKISAVNLPHGIILSGGGGPRVFNIDSDAKVVLECIEIRNGNAPADGGGIRNLGDLQLIGVTVAGNSASGKGGGVFNSGTLTVSDSLFADNAASSTGGGIHNEGASADLDVINTTFCSNTADGSGGGGLFNTGGGSATLNQVTVAGNEALNGMGGGLRNDSGALAIRNSIVTENRAATDLENSGASTLPGNNRFGPGAKLARRGNYGGKTETMPPLPDSPAVNAGVFKPLPDYDQRGGHHNRAARGGVDLGAVEALDLSDYQPDTRIGEGSNPATHKVDNLYNTGAGQKLTVKLKRTRKQNAWLSVQNDGRFTDDLTLRATRPNRTIKMTTFQITGGRQNVSAALKGAGFLFPGLAPGEIVVLQSQIKAKSRRQKAKQKISYTTTSGILSGQSDTNQANIKSVKAK